MPDPSDGGDTGNNAGPMGGKELCQSWRVMAAMPRIMLRSVMVEGAGPGRCQAWKVAEEMPGAMLGLGEATGEQLQLFLLPPPGN